MTRVGVIGVGSMGRHHARVYSHLQGADLVGVADVDEEVAGEIAAAYDTAVLNEDALIERAEAISVAVPTEHHFQIAKSAIDAGVHILVEKPFVKDPDRGERLINLAERANVRLQVGHIERFNPAVMALEDVLIDRDIKAYEVRRLGPDPERGIQDTVIQDLMIHDLDIVKWLADESPSEIQAAGRPDGKHASATLKFGNGTMATLTASRVTQRKVRELGIATTDGYVHVDYLDRQIEIFRDSMRHLVDRDGDRRYRHESVIERPFVDNSEPLQNELTAFIESVQNGTAPVVSGSDGLSALRLAQQVEENAFSAEVH